MFRILKSVLVLLIGLNALFYAIQNIANLDAAQGALGYVMSGTDHQAYPATAFFTTGNPLLHWIALALVLLSEFAVAFFGIKGAWDLFAARNATVDEFHAAKSAGVWAAGLALLTWFGLFMVFGGAFFQMWQTEVGAGSLDDAFKFAAMSGVTILFVCLIDDFRGIGRTSGGEAAELEEPKSAAS